MADRTGFWHAWSRLPSGGEHAARTQTEQQTLAIGDRRRVESCEFSDAIEPIANRVAVREQSSGGDRHGRVAREPHLERFEQARAVAGVVLLEREHCLHVDAPSGVEIAREQRIGGVVVHVHVRARANQWIVFQHATRGNMHERERETPRLQAAIGEAVSISRRTLLILLGGDESCVDEGAQTLGEHAARQAGRSRQIGEARARAFVNGKQQPQRPTIAQQRDRALARIAERHVERVRGRWFQIGTHYAMVAPDIVAAMPIPTHAGPIAPRRWAWSVLGVTLLMAAAIAAFNAAVDSTAQLGTGLLEPIAAGPRDRTAKAEILRERPSADLVVLGSSRSKKLDPVWLDAPNGVNAAVVGGDLFEARVFTRWLADRAQREKTAFPQLVVGVDVEQLRDSSLQGSGMLDVPMLAATARSEAAGGEDSLIGDIERLNRLLLTAQVTKASVASVRARVRGASKPAADAGDEPADRADFNDRGVPIDDADWDDPAVARARSQRTPAAIEHNVDELRAMYERNGSALDAGAVADLRALVRIARDAGGPPPLLYVTPGNRALEPLDRIGRSDRHAAVLALLHDVAAHGHAVVVDCARCVDDETEQWLDATHPSPLGMRQLATRLRDAVADANGQAPSATPTDRSGASK